MNGVLIGLIVCLALLAGAGALALLQAAAVMLHRRHRGRRGEGSGPAVVSARPEPAPDDPASWVGELPPASPEWRLPVAGETGEPDNARPADPRWRTPEWTGQPAGPYGYWQPRPDDTSVDGVSGITRTGRYVP